MEETYHLLVKQKLKGIFSCDLCCEHKGNCRVLYDLIYPHEGRVVCKDCITELVNKWTAVEMDEKSIKKTYGVEL